VNWFLAWLDAVWGILAESGPWLLAGFVIAGLIKELVPQEKVLRHFGGDDLKSVFKASLFGAPLPLCSCSVIPTARALRDGGASRGATTSFLIATPETGVDSIGVTWALFDPIMTVLRPIAAILTAIVSGTAVNRLVRRGKADVPPAEAATKKACCHEEPVLAAAPPACHAEAAAPPAKSCCAKKAAKSRRSPREVLSSALRYSFGTLMEDLTPWFLLGFTISGIITVAVPDGFFGDTVPSGWLSLVAMLGMSLPMYICATATTPVAAALVLKGLDPGAALVLLLAGPATNITTMLVIRDFLGRAVLRRYLASLAVVSLALGWLVNLLADTTSWDLRSAMPHLHDMGEGLVPTIGGIVLAGFLAWHAVRLRLDLRTIAWVRARLRGTPRSMD